MAVIKEIPRDSRFIQVHVGFRAEYNNPTAGYYDYGVARNQNREILELRPQSVYLLERMSINSDIPEPTYIEALSTGAGTAAQVPGFRLITQINQLPVYAQRIPVVNYLDSSEAVAYFWSYQKQRNNVNNPVFDNLLITASGRVGQPASMVGILNIHTYIQFNIYEIVNRGWITEFFDRLPKKERYIQ